VLILLEDVFELIYGSSAEDPKHEGGEVLGSMTTPPPPEALKTVVHFISKNLGDPSLFRSLEIITEKLEKATRDLLGLPSKMKGIMTSGGTESNILALYAFREALQIENVIFLDTAHYSISKASKLLKLSETRIATAPSGHPISNDPIEERTEGRSAIVLTMGTTELGGVDDPRELSFIKSGLPIHIDAAFGGFNFPFLNERKYRDIMQHLQKEDMPFTFSVDFHKFLGAPIPSGMLFVPEDLYDKLFFEVEYINAGRQAGILGTRPGFSSPAALATMAYYGKEGIISASRRAYSDAVWFLNEAEKRGLGRKVNEPEVPIGCLSTQGFIESSALIDELAKMKLFVYRGTKCGGIRVVVMPHVERKHLEKLLDAIELVEKRVKR